MWRKILNGNIPRCHLLRNPWHTFDHTEFVRLTPAGSWFATFIARLPSNLQFRRKVIANRSNKKQNHKSGDFFYFFRNEIILWSDLSGCSQRDSQPKRIHEENGLRVDPLLTVGTMVNKICKINLFVVPLFTFPTLWWRTYLFFLLFLRSFTVCCKNLCTLRPFFCCCIYLILMVSC